MTSDLTAAFRANMRATREARGLSQAGLAEHLKKLGLNWAQPTVQRIEAGHRGVDLEEAYIIARALDTTVQALLTGESSDAGAAMADQIRRALEAVDDAAADLHRGGERYTRAKTYLASLHPASLPESPLRSAALAALASPVLSTKPDTTAESRGGESQ